MIEHNTGNLVFALSAGFDAVVVVGAVIWAARRERPAGRLALSLAAAGAVLVLKTFVLLAAGLEIPFGVMHVVWLDLVVVAPLAGLALLVLTRRRAAGVVLRACAAGAVLLAPVGVYASFVEPGRLEVERAELRLPVARAGDDPLRVGVIADLQFEHLGDHEREAVDRLLSERPDVILLAGDYHQGTDAGFERELPGLRALLRRLRAPGGVYAVQGDVEGTEEAQRVMAGTGVTLLLNGIAEARVGDRRLTVGGVELKHRSHDAGIVKGRLEQGRSKRDVRILLAHRPDAVLDLPADSRVDLIVAGHTHGGQVQLPFFGPPVISSKVPRDVGAGGLHRVSGHWIYLSRGVGVERGQAPRLRLGAPPEVGLVTLR